MPAGASTGTAEISPEHAGYTATGGQFKTIAPACPEPAAAPVAGLRVGPGDQRPYFAAHGLASVLLRSRPRSHMPAGPGPLHLSGGHPLRARASDWSAPLGRFMPGKRDGGDHLRPPQSPVD
jgi:hypothetical protein